MHCRPHRQVRNRRFLITRKWTHLPLRTRTPTVWSIPSNKYPTSSINRLLSPLLLSSVTLFKSFIMFGGSTALGRSLAFPFPFRPLSGSGDGCKETAGRGSSSELSTPHRSRKSLYDSRTPKVRSSASNPLSGLLSVGSSTKKERDRPA